MTDLIRRFRREDDDVIAHCPYDDWDFPPRYTDGACPICGWRPEGIDVEPPLTARIDWFWPSIGLLGAVSIVMCVLVIVAYVRG